MNRTRISIMIVLTLIGGAAVGIALAKKPVVEPDVYVGKTPDQAAEALLKVAEGLTGNGSWETIAVARVYYLSGQGAQAEALLEPVLSSPKAGASDWLRAGRLYFEVGEWDKAEAAFAQVLKLEPKNGDMRADVGAYYNLHGDREKAEELFGESFGAGTTMRAALAAAGSYVGVPPRKR